MIRNMDLSPLGLVRTVMLYTTAENANYERINNLESHNNTQVIFKWASYKAVSVAL